ncbi:MAG: hypothetical protein Q7U98_20335 [Methylicorpusculum sp.]|uniref:hypothetical protein n=1 Tax=Methylicorpusculum sp. TaxID=2713644 RepID=UPI002728D159|nr:hypothetical protein [Methylicorpusculum sp.]MDO8941514.1 hypothetical protein [Methylicorpusculum sp.]
MLDIHHYATLVIMLLVIMVLLVLLIDSAATSRQQAWRIESALARNACGQTKTGTPPPLCYRPPVLSADNPAQGHDLPASCNIPCCPWAAQCVRRRNGIIQSLAPDPTQSRP